ERLSKASPQVGSTPGAGFDLEMKRKKMRALRRRLACRQKSFANRRPESVQLRPCRLQPDSRPKPPGSFKPTRIRALQVFLDIGLAVQQGLSRKRHGDFRRSLSADPVEAFSSHANNSEGNAFDLDSLAENVRSPTEAALPIVVMKHGHLRRGWGVQIQ